MKITIKKSILIDMLKQHDATADVNAFMGLEMSEALTEACAELNKNGKSFFHGGGPGLADFARHPDSKVILAWLNERGAAERDFAVIAWMASAVRSEWANLPKRTAKQHRALYQRVEQLCRELHASLQETGMTYMRGGGWGLRHASVRDLLSDAEEKALAEAVSSGDSDLTDLKFQGAFPTAEEVLVRLAWAAKRLRAEGPVHAQPQKQGAERGYFVRRMGELFMQRYQEVPMEVIAALTTIALESETDRELVAALLRRS